MYIQSINSLYWRETPPFVLVIYYLQWIMELCWIASIGHIIGKTRSQIKSYVYRNPKLKIGFLHASASVIILCIGIISYAMFFVTPRKLRDHKDEILKELRFLIVFRLLFHHTYKCQKDRTGGSETQLGLKQHTKEGIDGRMDVVYLEVIVE